MNARWNLIYENNKKTDLVYNQKYGDNEEIFRKNCIELLVELGEFINETKCFKYWTIKKPEKDKVLDEYADCILMVLYFYNKLDMEIEESIDKTNMDLLDLINETYYLSTKIMNEFSKELMKNIFDNLINIAKLLNYSEEDILNGLQKKEEIVIERLNSDY